MMVLFPTTNSIYYSFFGVYLFLCLYYCIATTTTSCCASAFQSTTPRCSSCRLPPHHRHYSDHRSPIIISSNALLLLRSSATTTGDDASTTTASTSTTSATTTGLSLEQEDELDKLLTETLERMSFIMESTEALMQSSPALEELFETCRNGVSIAPSTIPQAGRGLFAARDIPQGTIVAFYPVHSMGCKFETTGLCQSVQLAKHPNDLIDNEKSAYAIFSLAKRPLLGNDLAQYAKNARLFVDMNPSHDPIQGWYCGMINDGAVAERVGDESYYPRSRQLQNVEIVPFSVAPFQVGVTTSDVAMGEELFVSYGYNYWVNYLVRTGNGEWTPKTSVVEHQEKEAAVEMFEAVELVQEKYKEAAWVLGEIFDHYLGEGKKEENTTEHDCLPKILSKRKRLLSFLGRTLETVKSKFKSVKIT